MGFGYGKTTYWSENAHDADGKRVRKTYDASMVAHIWANQSQDFARTGNGNFAFVGDTLYSYGKGWIVAKLWQGFALINGDKVSVTTSGHASDARGAVRHMSRFELPSFPDSLVWSLDAITARLQDITALPRGSEARREVTSELRVTGKAVLANAVLADALRSPLRATGEPYWSDANPDAPQFGDTLAKLCGLPANAWPIARAKHDAKAAADAKAKAAAERKAFIAEAREAVAMTDATFAASISVERLGYGGRNGLLQLAKRLRRFRLKADLTAKQKRVLWLRECAARDKAERFDALKRLHDKRKAFPALVRYIRNIPAMLSAAESTLSSHTVRTISDNLESISKYGALPEATRVDLLRQAANFAGVLATIREQEQEASRLAAVERVRINAEREVEAKAREAALRQAWLDGDSSVNASQIRGTFQRDDGTPYLRVAHDELQTSWGASVPLAHAVKVFRFVKLCREQGRTWRRNGATIRVGHFQVDSVSATGDFVAGCHSFAWPEVERVARMAGVFDLASDDAALEHKGVAA